MNFDELLAVFDTELKRGTMTLMILSQLQIPQYGYSLLQSLAEKEVEIEAGTLYPMLRRLEKQEILKSDWDTSESRPRKYYVLSEMGKEMYKVLRKNWERMTCRMSDLIGGKEDEAD